MAGLFTKKEVDFLKRHEVCALATSDGLTPHVTPVCYIYDGDAIWVAIDYDSKKYRNIKRNSRVALTVYEYRPSRGIMVVGRAEIVERGEEFREIYRKFYEKFDWVRRDPWGEGEAPFIKVRPERKASWWL